MVHLEELTVDDLQAALDDAEGKKPTLRLVAAIAYKRGVAQTELAEWFDVERRTIYNWLTRLEDGPLADASVDADRPGRPRKLTPDQRDQLDEALRNPPTAAGYDAEWWTPALVRRYVEETFGVNYSAPSCRRLMKEAGLRYEPRSPSAGTEAGSERADRKRGGRWIVDEAVGRGES